MERKLAAILSADVVGYSRMMGDDEIGTLNALKAVRKELIEPKVSQYNGRTFKLIGDGQLIEFGSIVEAVEFAIDTQLAMRQRNHLIPTEMRIVFRIGINLGDVIVEENDIYGDGVNVAARLESLAEPGGICISRSARDQVRDRMKIALEDWGEVSVKNIARPLRCFSVKLGATENRINNNKIPLRTQKKVNPRILVLPFKNASNIEDSDDLVYGIVEDLITKLSQIKSIEVISNAAANFLKDNKEKISEIQKSYNINFLLTGSIRSSGKKVRISVELLDPENNTNIWSQRFDRTFEDIFDIQDEIVRNVIFSLTGEIEVKTLERINKKPTNNLTSYEFLLKGRRLHHNYSKESHPTALKYFNKAIELDPENAAAHAWKACTVAGCLNRGFLEPSAEISRETILSAIAKAQEINQNDFECYRMLCRASLRLERNHEKSISFGKKAFELNPNDPRILWAYGTALATSGRGHEGTPILLKAYELSPHFGVEGNVDILISSLILSNFFEEKFSECLDWFKKMGMPDYRSFILATYSGKIITSTNFLTETIDNYLPKFQKFNHDLEIDEFCLKDKGITKKLMEHSRELFYT